MSELPPNWTYSLPENIPDTDEDKPVPGKQLTSVGAMGIPEIVFGGGSLGLHFNTPDWIATDVPFRTLRLALRYGIRFIDTAAHYMPSEDVLGVSLERLAPEFPRSSYRIMTKCGRENDKFDYSPEGIRQSVTRSLQKLKTPYLDVVLLHDVEFVASPVYPIPYCGDFGKALTDPRLRGDWGLEFEKPAKSWGSGDDSVLAAIKELQKMKEEGLIRAVGMSGYPLPTLLRLARLIANTPSLAPLDCLLSYSHSHLQNNRLDDFLNHFIQQGKIQQIFCASPFSMGLLAPKRPHWHPAPADMIEASRVAATAAQDWPGGLTNLALGFAFRRPKSYAETSPSNDVPTLVGLASLQEVHEAMAVWREVSIPGANTVRKSKEDMIRGIFTAAGWLNWSWSMPRNEDFDKLAVDQLGRKVRK